MTVEMFDYDKLLKNELLGNDELNKKFYNAYKMYYHFLLQFVDRVLNLRTADIEIKRLNQPIKAKKETKDLFYEMSYMYYFYIKNILHIERLNKESIEKLNKMYEQDDYIFDSNIINFILNTYISVIEENGKNELEIGIKYDFDSEKNDYYDLNKMFNDNNDKITSIIKKIDYSKEYISVPIVFYHEGYDEKTIKTLKKGYHMEIENKEKRKIIL